MAKINFVHLDQTALVRPYDDSGDYEPTPEERAVKLRKYFPQSDEPLQLFEVQMHPDSEGPPHVHGTDEIIYVLEGELRFGKRVVAAGDSVFVPGYTLYGFKVGPQGVRFLNFRPPGQRLIMFKDEFVSWRAAQGSESEASSESA